MKPTLHVLSFLPLAAMATAQWQAAAPATAPGARLDGGMTYDPVSARTILWGGGKTTFGNWNDTWAYDGANWSQLAPTASPSARSGIQLVADTLRGVIVMYGGLSASFFGGPSIDETWEYDGTTWTQVFTAHSPGGLGWYGMAYDSARARTVVYGGLPNNFFPLDVADTWEYDGVDWTHVVTANSPGPLENCGMCYMPSIGKTVVYGGIDVQIGGTTTTWGYNGVNWVALPSIGGNPGVRTMPRMVYDTDRGVCVLHGGMDPNNGTPFNDTWEYDGAQWTQRVGTAPAARRGQGFAFDGAHHAGVYFGGVTQSFSGLTDTWNYGALMDSQFGAGCPGSNGVPVLTAITSAHLGYGFATALNSLVPAAPIAVLITGFTALPSPADLSPFGLPGCSVYATIDDIAVIAASGGAATNSVAVPSGPASLLGASFYYYGLSFDTINAFGGVLSNTLHGQIGY